MKKLFLLLILSFFSVQGFAGSCPDGSEPTKTISSDGTFFEYKCGNKKADEFEESTGILLADEAKEMFDDHVKQSELLKVPLPSHNRIIMDYERFKDYRMNRMAMNWSGTSHLWNESPNGQLLTKEVCKKILTEFDAGLVGESKKDVAFIACGNYYATTAVLNLGEGIKLYQDLLLDIASSKNDFWVYTNSGKDDFNPSDYELWGFSSPLVTFYAANYDAFDYTDEERQIIESYYREKAMKDRLDRDGNRSRTSLCPITDPMKMTAKYTKVNNCGSVRFRFAPAELALAIVMQDKELWAKGLWDLDYNLSMIEKEGFFVPLSAKGCKALGYTWDTSKLLSMNVEMLKLADFNLLDYKTRHGKTVAEAYEMLFKQYEDITISNHIAKKGIGSGSCGEKPYKTHEEFLLQEFDPISNPSQTHDPAKLAKAYRYGQVPVYEDFINWSIRFVSEKHPEWLDDKFSPSDILVHEWLSNYYFVQAFEIFNANVVSENHSFFTQDRVESGLQLQETIKEENRLIQETIKEENRLRLKKNAEELKVKKALEQEQLLAEIPIYDMNEETLTLNVSLAEFIEKELPQKQNRNNNSELYKASINGELKLSENKKVSFRTLVFQKTKFQENRLSINVSQLTDPEMNPFKRHRETLQKECGFELMDQYDWLSFISKTNDIKNASNQQCHYDYFKKANDSEAFELFQAVLGGTDSILDYLETNVEK